MRGEGREEGREGRNELCLLWEQLLLFPLARLSVVLLCEREVSYVEPLSRGGLLASKSMSLVVIA